ncbi:nitroreductase [Bradyrhizobium sp. CCBAU 51627]|nr:nitroreductase [Bradyrhizobium sp. CCBAU 51627]
MARIPDDSAAVIIDRTIGGRYACRDFSNDAVSRDTIEEILEVARFAPSGANIQPWHVYALAGEAKRNLSARLLDAHRTARDEHLSEYKYYADELPSLHAARRKEFGGLFYGSLGIEQADIEARAKQTAKNYGFFGAPVGLIVTIDRRLEIGSWLDLGMFVQNILLAAAGRGLQSCPQETFAKYHRIIRPLLSIPQEQIVVCGISIGRARSPGEQRLMPRDPVKAFASFSGFEE